MERLFVFFLSSALVFLGSLAIPVTQKLVRLQPVPENFLDWPDSARRQILAAMDQAVIPWDQSDAYGDFRHLIGRTMTMEDPTEGSFPTQSGDLSFSSSSWSSMSTGEDDPEDFEDARIIYRQLYRYLSGNAWDSISSSIASQSSANSVVSASTVDRQGEAGGFADHLPEAIREQATGLSRESYDYSLSSYSDIGQDSEGGVTEQPDIVDGN